MAVSEEPEQEPQTLGEMTHVGGLCVQQEIESQFLQLVLPLLQSHGIMKGLGIEFRALRRQVPCPGDHQVGCVLEQG